MMEVETLQAARDEVKKKPHWYAGCPAAQGPARHCREITTHSTAAICRTLGIGRAMPYRATSGRAAQYAKADDPVVAAHIREIIRQRGSCGYRRVTALVNETFGTGYNRKRVRRVMELNAWNLPRGQPAPEWPGVHGAHRPQPLRRAVV